MDVLRLAGVPGVGKSTVAWALARRLEASGVRVGYIDIDQLGMCYPAPAVDPDRWALKETALRQLAAQFHNAGVKRLSVSGVADPAAPPPSNGYPTVSLWLCADEKTRRQRLAPRGWAEEQVDAVLSVGTKEAMAAHRSWVRLGTDGHTLEETVGAALARWNPDSAAESAPVTPLAEAGTTGRVVWITGPRCAGASSVGWEIARARWGAGQRTGFVDVAQLGFAWNTGSTVGVRNAAVLQRLFAAAGARTLIAVAPFEVAPADVQAAFPLADVWFFRLDADDDTRRDRALRRVAGSGPSLAGDDVIGATPRAIDDVVAVGAHQRHSPLREGERLIESTALSTAQVAADITARLSEPPLHAELPD